MQIYSYFSLIKGNYIHWLLFFNKTFSGAFTGTLVDPLNGTLVDLFSGAPMDLSNGAHMGLFSGALTQHHTSTAPNSFMVPQSLY